MFKSFVQKTRFFAVSVLAMIVASFIKSPLVSASVQNPTPQAQISFTFDDGGESDISIVAPLLAQYDITGTSYVVTSCVGIVVVPNDCNADPGIKYMTWDQIKALQNSYGWEIGSHSVSHPLLSEISASKVEKELANSKKELKKHGIKATSFATPFGDYDQKVLERIAKHYDNHRPFHDTGYNIWPYNDYMLRVQQVQAGVSVETVKGYIDKAVADNAWLILVFHDIEDQPATSLSDYQYSATDLAEIANYVKVRNIKTTNMSKGTVKADVVDNKVSEPVTGSTLGGGWTTDEPTAVKVDTTSKGNAPEPKKSIKATSNANKTVHIFAPTVNVKPASQYVVKGYINLSAVQNGSVGFYIDEYDTSGNWISGQYKQTIDKWYVKDLSFAYSATSVLVAKARLQIIITNNVGTIVYIDTIRWFEVVSGPAPEPEPINLIVNGDFEQGLSGWTVDNPAISLDVANHGTTPTIKNSAKLTNVSNKSVHLFAPKVSVVSSKTHKVSADLNVQAISSSGEIGFYIDEYDTNGNWISGQYLFTVRSVGFSRVAFNYTPTSVNVSLASLQTIVTKGSGTEAYLDNVKVVQA